MAVILIEASKNGIATEGKSQVFVNVGKDKVESHGLNVVIEKNKRNSSDGLEKEKEDGV